MLKTRLQSRELLFNNHPGVLSLTRSTIDAGECRTWTALRQRVRTKSVLAEGPRALFQGLAPRLLTYSVVKFSLFSLYEKFFDSFDSTFLAGACAGALNTAVSCPQDVLKTSLHMQVAGSRSVYVGPMETSRRLLRSHGWRVFYRGLRPLVLRDTIGYGVLYSVFFYGKAAVVAAQAQAQAEAEAALKKLPSGAGKGESGGGSGGGGGSFTLNAVWRNTPVWLLGGASGFAFYLTILPIDRVKTVMMSQSLERPLYATATACFRDLHRRVGWRGMYRGCGVTLCRTFVGQTAALTVYDYAKTAALPQEGGLSVSEQQ